jgi:hypothetical protein
MDTLFKWVKQQMADQTLQGKTTIKQDVSP